MKTVKKYFVKIFYTTERNGNLSGHWITSSNRKVFVKEKEIFEKKLLFGALELLHIIYMLQW